MEQVLEFIKANAGCTKAAITEGTGIKGLPLFNMLKKALAEKLITAQGEGNETVYTAAVVNIETETPDQNEEGATDLQIKNEGTENPVIIEDAENKDAVVEEKAEIKEGEKEKGNVPAAKVASSRDNSKLSLDGGEPMGKGPFVRHLLSVYVEQHSPITYKQLKEVFPDTLLKRFGIFQDEAKAREISGKRDRYFMKDTQLIKLKDKKIAVCSQFTFGNIQPFLKVAKELGYKIC